ncbi:MAG: hypothetical protein LBK66_09795 [Spirochaetaceae bacterium]|jgi:O-phosphoseryl-tRNA(Cys) synthetase|nr:hypothetical protein [Spirochaetaceae bacterium]
MKDERMGINAWIDGYIGGEIDSAIFSALVVLENIFTALSIDRPGELRLRGTINIAITRLASKKQLSPKEEQETKKKLREIVKGFNSGNLSEDDIAQCEEIVIKIMDFTDE